MKTDDGRGYFSYLTTLVWLSTKGLKSGRLLVAKAVFITAAAVTELSLLFWLTSGIIGFVIVSTTFLLFVLAISEAAANTIPRRAHRVGIMMAFGARRGQIALSLLIESAVGSLLGSLIGSVVGLIAMHLLSLSVVDLAVYPASFMLPFFLGFITGALASVYPILKITEPSIMERS